MSGDFLGRDELFSADEAGIEGSALCTAHKLPLHKT